MAFDARDALGVRQRGWGRYAACLLSGLREVGVDVRALTGRAPAGLELGWEQLGLPAAARRRAADVVHAPNVFLPLRRGGLAGVVTVHDLAFEAFGEDFAPRTRAKFRHLGRAAARGAQRVVVPSAFTASDVVERWSIEPRKVVVVPNAPALPPSGAVEARGDATPGPPYLLGVGDLRRKKDWATLVRAWRAVRGEGVPRLVLAGVDAGEGAALATLGGDGLELTGWVDDARLDGLLRGAVALVHPSRYEGFGLVVVEAMARGTPVACADATALPEAAGGAAALFAPGDVDACAAAIRTVLADPDGFAARGRARAAQLSWRASAQATAEVYAQAVREIEPRGGRSSRGPRAAGWER